MLIRGYIKLRILSKEEEKEAENFEAKLKGGKKNDRKADRDSEDKDKVQSGS